MIFAPDAVLLRSRLRRPESVWMEEWSGSKESMKRTIGNPLFTPNTMTRIVRERVPCWKREVLLLFFRKRS